MLSAITLVGPLCSRDVIVWASSANATTQTITVSVATAPAPAGVSGAGAGVAVQSPAVFNGLSFAGTVPADTPVQFATATNSGVVGLGSAGATVQISGPIDTGGFVSVSSLLQNNSGSCQGEGVVRVKTRCVRRFSEFNSRVGVSLLTLDAISCAEKNSLEDWFTGKTSIRLDGTSC